MEIKRLKETVDTRNKVILQLEAQVDTAASHIGSRDTTKNNDNPAATNESNVLQSSLSQIISKLDTLTDSLKPNSVNNITIHNLSDKDRNPVALVSEATQTDPVYSLMTEDDANECPETSVMEVVATEETPIERYKGAGDDLDGAKCNKTFISVKDMVKHIDSTHRSDSNLNSQVFDKSFDICSRKFSSKAHLKEHVETDHSTSPVKCTFCNYTCTTNSHLKNHIAALHSDKSSETKINPPL